jgi:hypothetical protein
VKPIKFKGCNCVYAENQPEYLPLPSLKKVGVEGEVISCWQMSWRELFRVIFTRRIYLAVWTFNKSLQPQRIFVTNPSEKKRGSK